RRGDEGPISARRRAAVRGFPALLPNGGTPDERRAARRGLVHFRSRRHAGGAGDANRDERAAVSRLRGGRLSPSALRAARQGSHRDQLLARVFPEKPRRGILIEPGAPNGVTYP